MNTTGLTDDEMRVRIARFCGWLEIEDKSSHLMMSEGTFVFGYPPTGAIIGCKAALPDYLNDLNAMHAAEKSIKFRHTLALYDEYLRREVNPNTDRLAKDWTWEELGRAARATARERALAFLAMLPEPEAGR